MTAGKIFEGFEKVSQSKENPVYKTLKLRESFTFESTCKEKLHGTNFPVWTKGSQRTKGKVCLTFFDCISLSSETFQFEFAQKKR